jgi:phosphoserine phosphatase
MYIDEPRTFILTDEHVTLLRHLNVDSVVDRAPQIDSRRPYGNGDYIKDMAELLGVEMIETWDEEMVILKKDGERLEKLHQSLGWALQVVLASGSFTPGVYKTTGRYERDWTLDETSTS